MCRKKSSGRTLETKWHCHRLLCYRVLVGHLKSKCNKTHDGSESKTGLVDSSRTSVSRLVRGCASGGGNTRRGHGSVAVVVRGSRSDRAGGAAVGDRARAVGDGQSGRLADRVCAASVSNNGGLRAGRRSELAPAENSSRIRLLTSR